jgi:hypothetical protein
MAASTHTYVFYHIHNLLVDQEQLLTIVTVHKSLTKRFSRLRKRQFDLAALLGGLGGSAAPPAAPKSTVPEVQELLATVWKDAKRIKIRYGPYRIPPISVGLGPCILHYTILTLSQEKNFQSQLMNVQGMVDTFNMNVKKPCDNHCTILSLFADLEFADGTAATNNDGAWFHHAVLLNSGPNIIETNCGGIGGSMGKVENIFMSGNEKSIGGFAIPDSNIKSGYSLTPQDKFIMTTELMNMKDKEQWVWMTLTFDFLPGQHPDFKQGKTVWQSIGPAPPCRSNKVKSNWGPSNLTMSQQPKSLKFSEHSHRWEAPRDGWVLGTGGHQHDGGTGTLIFLNDKVICESLPRYVKSSGHGHGSMGMQKRQLKAGDYNNEEIPHIEKQNACNFQDGIPIKKGDTMHIQVDYDFDAHPGMKNKKGELDEVMGIVGTLVAF